MARHSKQNGLLTQFGAIAITTALVSSGTAVSQSSATIQTIDLGSASSFAALAGSCITNTGSTTLSGTAGADIGCTAPTFAFTGNETVFTEGTKFLEPNPITVEAGIDLEAAYQDAVSKTPTSLGNFSLSGTLTPGVYNSASSLGIVGNLILDAEGNSDAIFIFQAGSTLTTSAGSEVMLINGAQASNVFWQVGSSATFGAGSIFMGRVMSLNNISAADKASFSGQLLAVNGAITLVDNNVVNDLSALMPTVLSTSKPSGDALIGSTLSSAVSFGGVPMPAVSYLWQFSQDGLTDWSLIEGEESSTLTLENIHVGGYLRTVVTATNIAGSITETSEKSTQVLPVAPTTLELVSSSNTGVSDSDAVTSEPNPEISLANLITSTEVVISASSGELQESCSFTASATTDSCIFSEPLAEGAWSFTAVNAVSGFSSANSDSLMVTIDQTAPKVLSFSVDEDSLAGFDLTYSLIFSESVSGLSAEDLEILPAGVCDAPRVSGSANSYNISVADCQPGDLLQLRLAAESVIDKASNSGPGEAFLTAKLALDETAPTVLNLNSSTVDGAYNQGDEIAIQIGFSESVRVSGIPTLTLETGNIDQVVDYSSGSKTKTLVFVYTVQPGDVSNSLDYLGITSLSLNGGTISDRAGNNAVLTLAEPGSVGSLAESSSFEIDGNVLALELTSSVSTTSTSSVSWSLDAKAELDCSTLSKTDGVDFDLDGLISIDSISSAADKNSCIITGTSPVDPAQFGTSSISISSEFSVEDSLGNLQSSASEEDTEILVTVVPESSGSGGITVTDTTGVIADQYELELNQALFSGASSTGLEEILGIGLVNVVEAAPRHSISVDQTEIIDPESVLNSMSWNHISAGDSISLELEVSEEISQHHSLAAYIKTGDNWSYAGLTDLNDSFGQTNEFTLTEQGTYHFRLFVVEEDFQAVTQTTAMSFANNFFPSISVMNISEQNLPETNLSHEAQIYVTDSVTTVSPSSPAPTPQPEDDTEQTPPATEEPEPDVPEETTPEETVPEETAPEETEPEETEPVAPEETEPAVPEDEDQLIPEGTNPDSATDTGGQLPDTGMTNWILPAGIGVLIVMLGVLVLISRRRMV